jgi:hypothetical protein
MMIVRESVLKLSPGNLFPEVDAEEPADASTLHVMA